MAKRTGSLLTLLICLFVALAAQGAEEKRLLICKKCNMPLAAAEQRFSVSVPKGIEASAFNDIGCLIAWRNSECAMRQSAIDSNAVVRDFSTGEEVAAEQAFYVVGSETATPRKHDIIAFKSKERAEAFTAEKKKGSIMNYRQVVDVKVE